MDRVLEGFMEHRKLYESTVLAVKMARNLGVGEDVLSSIYSRRQLLNKERKQKENAILREIKKTGLPLRLSENWYGICYQEGRKSHLLVQPLIIQGNTIGALEENFGKVLTKSQLFNLLPYLTDYGVLDSYKQEMESRASQQISEYGVYPFTYQPEFPLTLETNYQVSFHCRKRYALRILGIKREVEAEEYANSHFEEINLDICNRLKESELVWTGLDGIMFRFDTSNYMYLIGENNNVITLYEENFGWSKQINRSIVYQQLELLSCLYSDLCNAEGDSNLKLEEIETKISDIGEEIALLEARITSLKSQKDVLEAQKIESCDLVKSVRAELDRESNKLFKFTN